MRWVNCHVDYAKMKITDISLFRIYLPKLQGNIMKYFRFNLFKEIAIGFEHGLQSTSEYPASLFDGLPV